MSEEIKVNRPPMHSSRPEEGRVYREERGSSRAPWIVLVIVIVIVAIAALLFRDKLFTPKAATTDTAMKAAGSSGYQAVFLTNGQVYFGKLSDEASDYVTLKDIFYLQVTQPALQGSQQQQQQSQAQSQQQPQLSLVKLGNELHGPVDEMKINHSQILFYEDMKTDGKVYQAIKEYKANPQAATPAPSQPTPAPTQQITPPPAPVK